jgi:hypothetical protein
MRYWRGSLPTNRGNYHAFSENIALIGKSIPLINVSDGEKYMNKG